ncbi:MAG: hypothetical protein RBR14_06455 [Candidatus Cloacimonas acidaminovorans]|nr:hypothetical protein [Candidatus Cloacimonas acidaminovorans]
MKKIDILSIVECILFAIFILSVIATIILLCQMVFKKIDNFSYLVLFTALETLSVGGLIAIDMIRDKITRRR